MVSFVQLVNITGLLLVCFIMYSQQAALSPILIDDQMQLEKRRIDANARTSIPLFRGSNLGIFVRKRPYAAYPEHSIYRRKEIRSIMNNDESDWADLINNNEHFQRRFDDYSENPGPMFG